ncbi:hypothetical protein IGI04_018123 [Brassica rapa subsp. trilocularis]|uniref:Secreted protein n=1 Tax=Brassica rapa subsp. trilocularis TaxID=1813537 RepID=A0ABQ7MC10_BRACM|nr:hypothetical protein IGI04_018123 [Brassica rapa subsp. trilocularis]
MFQFVAVRLSLFTSGPDGAWRRVPASGGSSFLISLSCFAAASSPFSPSICSTSWARVWRRKELYCRGASAPVVSYLSLGLRRGGRAGVGNGRDEVASLDCRWFADLVGGVIGLEWGFSDLGVLSSSLGSILAVVCAGGSYYHGGEFDGSSSTNFSSLVLDGFGRVVVLVSLTAASSVRLFAHIPASQSSRRAVLMRAIIFKSGSSERPKLPGSDSRLNLARLFAASGGADLVELWDCGSGWCLLYLF